MITSERWQRVRDLFEQAIDRSPTDLHAWLTREAAGDEEVVAEVESLLQHNTRAGSFLAEPVVDRVAHLFEDERFAAGSTIGPYKIVRELGRGGMGRVYLATDQRLHRTVALKALPPAVVRDAAQRERLRREARAAAGLIHPGICTIYALEEFDGDVFIAAEFVDGHSLRDEMARGDRPSASAIVEAARELASALAMAHANGITHRDLKPENVMRARDGRLKILDFGLAIVDPAQGGETLPRVTAPGTIVGTPAYMSPEQLTGGSVNARADVFALGVLLYEFASGRHPFEAESPLALAARVLESEPKSIKQVRPDLPDELVFVIEKCLRKVPGDRFASAGEIVGMLVRVNDTKSASGVTAWWRNHQLVAIGLYFVATALAWQIKEWQHGLPDSAFLILAVLATVAGIFRGHLLFTERMNRASFEDERRRAEPITYVVDVLIALALVVEGLQLTSTRPLAGVLTIALGIGIGLTRLIVEPATTRGAFGGRV